LSLIFPIILPLVFSLSDASEIDLSSSILSLLESELQVSWKKRWKFLNHH
jgi:hypothetical protein